WGCGVVCADFVDRRRERRRRRDELRVRLHEVAGGRQRVAVRVVRPDEELRLRLVCRGDLRADHIAGDARDPCRDEERPPPAARDRKISTKFHATPLASPSGRSRKGYPLRPGTGPDGVGPWCGPTTA